MSGLLPLLELTVFVEVSQLLLSLIVEVLHLLVVLELIHRGGSLVLKA